VDVKVELLLIVWTKRIRDIFSVPTNRSALPILFSEKIRLVGAERCVPMVMAILLVVGE
jgi:hypothetical protein